MSSRRLRTLIVAGGLLAGCGTRMETRLSGDINDYPLLSSKTLGTRPATRAPQISPDGSLISYIAPHDGVPNFFVAPTGDISAAKPVTTHTGRGVRRPMSAEWSCTAGTSTADTSSTHGLRRRRELGHPRGRRGDG